MPRRKTRLTARRRNEIDGEDRSWLFSSLLGLSNGVAFHHGAVRRDQIFLRERLNFFGSDFVYIRRNRIHARSVPVEESSMGDQRGTIDWLLHLVVPVRTHFRLHPCKLLCCRTPGGKFLDGFVIRCQRLCRRR